MSQLSRTLLSIVLIVLLGFLGSALFELLFHFADVIQALDKSPGLAAWAQAAGGIAAVIAAFSVTALQSSFQRRQSLLRKRERGLAALAMMEASIQAIQGLSNTIPDVAGLRNFLNSGVPIGFGIERAMRQLERLPVWELGNASAVTAVDFMLRVMATALIRAQDVVSRPLPVDAADPHPSLAELRLDVQRAITAREQLKVALGL